MYNNEDVNGMLDKMSGEIQTLMGSRNIENYSIIGIRTGGVWVAQELANRLSHTQTVGELNITFYRDDFTRIGLHPQVQPSHLPFEVDQQHILLIDDVLMSGRTVRAAMNEIFDYGRPASISLGVLVDLQQQELPIKPDVIGAQVQLQSKERITLTGPENLQLTVETING